MIATPSDVVREAKRACLSQVERKCFYFSQTGTTNHYRSTNQGPPYFVNYFDAFGIQGQDYLSNWKRAFAGVSMLSSISRGVRKNQRIGNKIRVHAMHFKVRLVPSELRADGGTLTTFATPARPHSTTARVLVIKDYDVTPRPYESPAVTSIWDTSAIRDVGFKLFNPPAFQENRRDPAFPDPTYAFQWAQIATNQPIPGQAKTLSSSVWTSRQPWSDIDPLQRERFKIIKDVTGIMRNNLLFPAANVNSNADAAGRPTNAILTDSDWTLDFSITFGPVGEVFQYTGDFDPLVAPVIPGDPYPQNIQWFESAGYNGNMSGKDVLFIVAADWFTFGQMTCNIIFSDA